VADEIKNSVSGYPPERLHFLFLLIDVFDTPLETDRIVTEFCSFVKSFFPCVITKLMGSPTPTASVPEA
jgi:hypothetical protein